MGAQPLLSGMFDFTLFNNRLAQQGLGGLTGGGSTSFNSGPSSSLNQMQMAPATSQTHHHQSGTEHHPISFQATAPATNSGGIGDIHQANPMSSFSAADILQLSRMHNPSSAPETPQQQLSMNRGSSSGPSDVLSSSQRQLPLLPSLESGEMPSLPPLEESQTPHWTQRSYVPFSVDEDPNWLSSFQCFIRSEILELFRVSQQGIKVRNAMKSLTVNQVGIRCRFCAHLQHGTRANRASCFPSKIDKIYQVSQEKRQTPF